MQNVPLPSWIETFIVKEGLNNVTIYSNAMRIKYETRIGVLLVLILDRIIWLCSHTKINCPWSRCLQLQYESINCIKFQAGPDLPFPGPWARLYNCGPLWLWSSQPSCIILYWFSTKLEYRAWRAQKMSQVKTIFFNIMKRQHFK